MNVELEELNVPGSPSTSTGTIAKPLLFSAAPVAVPACEAAQLGSAAGHVINVLPVTQMAPVAFVLNRAANGSSTTAPAVAGAIAPTASATTPHLTTRHIATASVEQAMDAFQAPPGLAGPAPEAHAHPGRSWGSAAASRYAVPGARGGAATGRDTDRGRAGPRPAPPLPRPRHPLIGIDRPSA